MTPAYSLTDDDCLRVATASILDLHPRRVPHFIKRSGYWVTVWRQWLSSRGITLVQWPIDTLADAPKGWRIAITDEDPTDCWSHAIVMRGRRVAHDPDSDPPLRRKYVCGYTLERA